MSKELIKIPVERIEQKILEIRGERVLLDSDLAEVYGVTTKVLNQAIKRNADRFPSDFFFRLTNEEFEVLRSQFVTSNDESLILQSGISRKGRGGRRFAPFVFTEHGALMAANVLNSPRAVEASVQVIRAFVKMRNLIASNAELSAKITKLEAKYDTQFKSIFDAIKKLMMPPDKPKGGIGFINKK